MLGLPSLLCHLRNNTMVVESLVIYERLMLVKWRDVGCAFWDFHRTLSPSTLVDGMMGKRPMWHGWSGEDAPTLEGLYLWNAPIEGFVIWKCALQVDNLQHHPFLCFLIVVNSPYSFQIESKIFKSKHFIGWHNDVATPIEVEDETTNYYWLYNTSWWLLSNFNIVPNLGSKSSNTQLKSLW